MADGSHHLRRLRPDLHDGDVALEGRGRVFVLAFGLGCSLSTSYGSLSGAWPFGVVERIWTFIALRRYLVTGRSGEAAS